MKQRWMLLAALLLSTGVLANPQAIDSPINLQSAELEELIGERSAVFYAHDLESDERFVYSAERINERHQPFSTFKIPNLLIALETGVEKSLDSSRAWDAERRPEGSAWPSDWTQEHTLRSAFQKSVVWYFRDIALEVGGERYRHWLEQFDYGNAQAPDDNDLFWLRGPLDISVLEQTQFIARLVRGELPVSNDSMGALIEASWLDQHQGYVLHGKTGAGSASADWSGPFRGWLVGWVERPDQAPVVYALFVEGPSFASIRTFRKELAIRLLQQAQRWPE